MKYKASFVLCLIFLTLFFALSCETAATDRIRPISREEIIYYSTHDSNKRDDKKNPQPVLEIKKVGDEWSVSLDENPTTGFLWTLKTNNGDLAEINEFYSASENQDNLLGMGGKRVWKIKAVKTGMLELHFTYARPWEKDKIQNRIDLYYSISN